MANKGNGKPRVACFGYNGVNNTGSEAKLLTTLNTIKKVMGDRIDDITVLTLGEENQKRYLDVKHPDVKILEVGPALPYKNPKALFDLTYDILFLSEGSTFIDHFSSLFLWAFCGAARIAKRRGHKVVAYSNDCGHLKPMNQRLLKSTLNKLDLILLRNPDAASRMKEYGVTNKITVTADGAYEYPLPPKKYRDALFKKLGLDPKKKPLIGIAPKEFFWWPIVPKPYGPKEDLYMYPFYHSWPKGGKESSEKYIRQSARHADWCVEEYDADVVLISMEHMDYPPTKRIQETMKHRDRSVIVASDDYVVDDIISVLSGLTALVTTRYHAVVLSSCSGIPLISVSSDTRCEAVHRELDMMDLFIDYVKHPDPVPNVLDLDDKLIEMTKILMKNKDELKQRISKAHKSFVKRAHQNEVLLQEWFDANYPA